jgi:HAE1 family hydrophobic/amphiphilic exporter-1/multidrug efflux pump
MARYFIDRPIFAWVIAIVLMLAGVLAIRTLPVAQFPAIAAPQVEIQATYPGADAQTLENTTTQIIEQQMKGIDNLRYMASTSSSAGTASITLTFEQGTNPDIAQVQVQNKLQAATPLLPQEVQQQGVRVVKSTRNFLIVVGLYSPDGHYSTGDLADFIVSRLQDPLSRVQGVGDTQVFGSQYAMRIWVDPLKLNNFHLTVGDVQNAVRAQNAQVSAGQIGGLPAPREQMLNASVAVSSRLNTPDQFRQIRLKSNPDGSVVRLGDVARVEMGSETYAYTVKYNGVPAAGMAIKLAPGANALDTVARIKARMNDLSKTMPGGIKVIYPYDSTPFVHLSIVQVVHTLVIAVVLVFIVMFIFLQNWRATIIPTIAVPVVLLGRLLDQHLDPVRHGAGDRPAGRRRDRGGRECRAADRERGSFAEGSGAQVDGRDHRRAGRHRRGARGGIPADGLLRGLDRRDLPPILDHDRLGDGAVGTGRADPDTGALRDDPQASQRASARQDRPVRLVQPHVRSQCRALPERRPLCGASSRQGLPGIRSGLRRPGLPLLSPADRLPARRGSGHRLRAGQPAAGRHHRAHRGRARAGARPFPEE